MGIDWNRKLQREPDGLLIWQMAEAKAMSLVEREHLRPENLEILLTACSKPQQLDLLMDLFEEYSKEYPLEERAAVHLFRAVEHSPFNLTEWVLGLEFLYQWLVQNNHTTSLVSAVLYIQAAIVGGFEGADACLVDLLAQQLDLYGWES